MLKLSAKNYEVKTFSPQRKQWIIDDLRSGRRNQIYAREFEFVELDGNIISYFPNGKSHSEKKV